MRNPINTYQISSDISKYTLVACWEDKKYHYWPHADTVKFLITFSVCKYTIWNLYPCFFKVTYNFIIELFSP